MRTESAVVMECHFPCALSKRNTTTEAIGIVQFNDLLEIQSVKSNSQADKGIVMFETLNMSTMELRSEMQVLKGTVAALESKASEILDAVKNSTPVGTPGVLTPIAAPRRGSDYNRSISVAAFMREKICP